MINEDDEATRQHSVSPSVVSSSLTQRAWLFDPCVVLPRHHVARRAQQVPPVRAVEGAAAEHL